MADSIRSKFTPFPRFKKNRGQAGNQWFVDIPKIKEMYLSSPHFKWADFCRSQNFNSNAIWFKKDVDWEQWKREWIQRQCTQGQEDVAPEMVKITKAVALGRIKYVQDWTKTAQNMKALLMHLLNRHIEDAAHDQQNVLAIRAGTVKRKCTLEIDELNSFSVAGGRIQELESRALMIVGDSVKQKELEHQEENNNESIPEMDIVTMGDTGMSTEERTRLLASYFDQFQPEEKPNPKEENATEQNQG